MEFLLEGLIRENKSLFKGSNNPESINPIKAKTGVIITHYDLDGISSSCLFKMAGYNIQKTIFLRSKEWYRILDKVNSPIIIILDLYCDENALSKLEQIRKEMSITYVDHHPVTGRYKNELKKLCFKFAYDTTSCTSILTYNLLKRKFKDDKQALRVASYGGITDGVISGLPYSHTEGLMSLQRSVFLCSAHPFLTHVEQKLLDGSFSDDPSIKEKSRIMEELISHFHGILMRSIKYEDESCMILETDKQIIGSTILLSEISRETRKNVYLFSVENESAELTARPNITIYTHLGKRCFDRNDIERVIGLIRDYHGNKINEYVERPV